jgi:hypothetical protein
MQRDLRKLIEENAAELRRLHGRIHETFAQRGKSDTARRAWSDACAEFHARYNVLAFPGAAFDDALPRLLAGERNTMEAALVFLELRPYFFRSGYMHKKLLRYAKRAPFDKAQAQRLQVVLQRAAAWKASKASKQAARPLSRDELLHLLERRRIPRSPS